MSQKPYHHGGLREALISKALEIINQEGKEKLNFRRLGNELGVSAMAAYRHFDNKEQLLQAAAKQGFETLTAWNQQAYADCPLEQFVQQGVIYVKFAMAHPAHYRLMFASDQAESWNEELKQASQLAFQELVDGIQHCCTQHSLRADLDVMTAALICWTQVHGIADLFATGQINTDLDAEAFAHRACTTTVQGLFQGLAPAI